MTEKASRPAPDVAYFSFLVREWWRRRRWLKVVENLINPPCAFLGYGFLGREVPRKYIEQQQITTTTLSRDKEETPLFLSLLEWVTASAPFLPKNPSVFWSRQYFTLVMWDLFHLLLLLFLLALASHHQERRMESCWRRYEMMTLTGGREKQGVWRNYMILGFVLVVFWRRSIPTF